MEVVALHHPGHGVAGASWICRRSRQGLAPLAVVANLGLGRVQHHAGLLVIGLGVHLDLLGRERRAGTVAADGSPIRLVKSPIRKMTWWPRSCNCRILFSTTVWPMWMSGAVGSRPSLMRSGWPVASERASFLTHLVLRQQLLHAAQRDFEALVLHHQRPGLL